MHLTHLRIENFGGLSDFEWSLTEGKNALVKENGWGKSTLATFIRVMFYGFLDDRRHNPWENDRKKYFPFNGGIYGGSIDFEKGDRVYHLERTFGYSGTKEDTFRLFDALTGRASASYDANTLGKGLFGIDGKSFENTLFITSRGCVSEVTGDIHASITDAGKEEADLSSFGDAKETLHRAINDRGPRYNGRLRQIDAALKENMEILAGKGEAEKYLSTLKDRENCLKSEILDLQKDRALLQREAKRESLKNDARAENVLWERLRHTVSEAERKVREEEKNFPGGAPDGDALEKVLRSSRTLETEKRILQENSVTEEEKAFIRINEEIPDCDLMMAEEENRRLIQLKRKRENQAFSEREECLYREGREIFGDSPVSEEDILAQYSLYQKGISKRAALEMKKAGLTQMKKKKISPLLYIGAIAVCLGGVLLALQGVPGAVMMGAGVALLLGGRAASGPNPAYEKLRADIRRDDIFIQKVEKDTRRFIEGFGITAERDAEASLRSLLEKRRVYGDLMTRKKSVSTPKAEEIEGLDDALRQFYLKYHLKPEDNKALQIERLRQRNEKILRIREKVRETEQRKEKIQACQNEMRGFIQAWQLKERYDDLYFTALIEKKNRLEERKKDFEKALQELQNFEKAHGSMKEQNDAGGGDLLQVQKNVQENIRVMEEKKDDLRRLAADIDVAAARLDGIHSAEEKRIALMEEKARTEREIWILTETEKCLDRARDKFLLRYQGGIEKAFRGFLQVITGEAGEEFFFDADLEVMFKKDGGTRHFGFLSEGQKDLVALAKRLAFIEAMYGGESMMLLFDDPFASLDDNNLKGARALMTYVAQRHQVIYLTCTQARRL